MKTVSVVCLLFAAAFAFPASTDEDSSESEFFGPINKNGGGSSGVEVDGTDSDESPFFFTSLFRPFSPIPSFKVDKVPRPWFTWSRPTSWYDWDFDFRNLFSIFDEVGRPPQGAKANSTSTVKIVNGEKITVNTTTYVHGGSVQKIKIVEIVPVNPHTSVEGEVENEEKVSEEEPITQPNTPESTSPRDDSNDSLGNEIIGGQREEFHRNDWNREEALYLETQPKFENINRFQTDSIDLSNDIRVNDIAQAAAMNFVVPQQPPADVELLYPYNPSLHYAKTDRLQYLPANSYNGQRRFGDLL